MTTSNIFNTEEKQSQNIPPNHQIRVLIVAENASMKFGGEASLPCHYFRVLRQRQIDCWLLVHERPHNELQSLFSEDFNRIYFVPDTLWHRIIYKTGTIFPKRLSDFTFGLILRLTTQIIQRQMAKQIIEEKQINIVHQPILVSPKEPSMMFDLGVPVIMGPMNGGMGYPPAFQPLQNQFVELSVKVARVWSQLFNMLIPGKLKATVLLVSNKRTCDALPKGVSGKIIEMVENGVDLSVWQLKSDNQNPVEYKSELDKTIPQKTTFVFVGRLVDWKGVDLLLTAFKGVSEQVPAVLKIIGDGKERKSLTEQAKQLALIQCKTETQDTIAEQNRVEFTGWLSQVECAKYLKSADVLVLPSLFECGGAVVLEAMAMGLPVIATNWGGPADYVDESCGILVEPASVDSFIADLTVAMIKMAKSPELRLKLGQAGRQRIIDEFDWEKKVDKMLEIYQEAISQE